MFRACASRTSDINYGAVDETLTIKRTEQIVCTHFSDRFLLTDSIATATQQIVP